MRAKLFSAGPLSGGSMLDSGSDQFATLTGLASDDVARIVAFLANGQTIKVPLRDNVYLLDLARSKMPVRLVAYDSQNRVIGIQAAPGGLFGGGPIGAPTAGRAVSVLKLTSPTGATAELLIGPASDHGHCYYVRTYFSKRATGEMVSCSSPASMGQPLQLGTSGDPWQFIEGRVRADVATVKVTFADGATMTVKPIQGFVLAVIPRRQLVKGAEVSRASGYNAAGRKVGSESLRPPKRSGAAP